MTMNTYGCWMIGRSHSNRDDWLQPQQETVSPAGCLLRLLTYCIAIHCRILVLSYLLVQCQRLLCDKSCLRHWPLHTVYQQQHSVTHVQHTLNFTTKVRVTGSVDDVDLDALVPTRQSDTCTCSNMQFARVSRSTYVATGCSIP